MVKSAGADINIVFNGKRIMNVMAARMKCGAEIEIQCSAPREEKTPAEAAGLVKSGLGEE